MSRFGYLIVSLLATRIYCQRSVPYPNAHAYSAPVPGASHRGG